MSQQRNEAFAVVLRNTSGSTHGDYDGGGNDEGEVDESVRAHPAPAAERQHIFTVSHSKQKFTNSAGVDAQRAQGET